MPTLSNQPWYIVIEHFSFYFEHKFSYLGKIIDLTCIKKDEVLGQKLEYLWWWNVNKWWQKRVFRGVQNVDSMHFTLVFFSYCKLQQEWYSSCQSSLECTFLAIFFGQRDFKASFHALACYLSMRFSYEFEGLFQTNFNF